MELHKTHKDFIQMAQQLDRMFMSVLKQTIKDK